MKLEEAYKKFDYDVKHYKWIVRVLLSIDQFFNVLLWNGSHDETISGHIGRRIETNTATWFDKLICRGLRALESKHCMKSRWE